MTALHRPVRLRQEHVPALPQPHERPDPGARGRGRRCATTATDLYGRDVDPVEVRRRIGMVFQKPNPFPKSIYDNVAFGPRIARAARATWTSASSARCARRRSGTRSRTGSSRRRCRPLGRPAAAALHRALPRGRARGAADGRAVLGARPDLDGAHRGPDARAQARVHDRDRDPQHAAGRARRRPHGLLQRRGRASRRPPQRRADRVSTRPLRIFTNPRDPRTEAYVTGRFG